MDDSERRAIAEADAAELAGATEETADAEAEAAQGNPAE
jgi:hypothetical protein